MKKVCFLLLNVFCFGRPTLQAQIDFWQTRNAYLGQKPPNDTPITFAPGILAVRDSFAVDRVAFSATGKEFYYTTNTAWLADKGMKVRYFKFDSGKWIGPFVLNAHYYAPTFSPDDKAMYFLGGKGDGKHDYVWKSKRTATGWTEPLEYLKNVNSLYDFMPTASGTAYVGSNVNGGKISDLSSYDICELKSSPKGVTIRSLGGPLNTPGGYEGDFFVAKDESYIIVSAKESKDLEGELWISFRKPDKTWTSPLSLGPLINHGIAHRWGQYVTPDGKYLFYSTGHSAKDSRIVWVRFDQLMEKLKRVSLNK